jgi:hypothetical protein
VDLRRVLELIPTCACETASLSIIACDKPLMQTDIFKPRLLAAKIEDATNSNGVSGIFFKDVISKYRWKFPLEIQTEAVNF